MITRRSDTGGYHTRIPLIRTFLLIAAAALVATSGANAAEPEAVDFNRDIKPIFAAHCIACHGPEKQEGGLRLDHRATALRGGDSGAAFTPGKPGESELLSRITSDDETVRMPPADSKVKPPSADQIALIRKWIEAGANWPQDGKRLEVTSDHWSFQPIERPDVPAVKQQKWVRNPIDAFVLARLENRNITVSPEADRYTLIKRLYYDLIGLPPTPAEVDEFVSDKSPDAYERLVDRLLASPHFGERWGRHWLDKARYADSDGYEKDRPRPNAWRYRDWVIEAINDDLPFDEFTREQLAGDLLPGATDDHRLATAFHRQTLTNTEGGADQEQFRAEAIFDRISTTSAVWLGLTVACAQCHTHKYDPITQAEYYQFYAFFNNGDETTTSIPISDEAVARYEREQAAYKTQLDGLNEKISEHRQSVQPQLADWEAEIQAKIEAEKDTQIAFHPLEVLSTKSGSGAKTELREDGSVLVSGTNPQTDTYTIIARADVRGLTGLKLETLTDPALPSKGPGRTSHGNFVLSEIRLSVGAMPAATEKGDTDLKDVTFEPVSFAAAESDFAQSKFDPAGAISSKEKTGWAISPQMSKDHHAIFSTAEPVNDAEPVLLKIELVQEYGTQHTIGCFRLTAKTGNKPGTALPDDVRKILAVAPDKRNDKQTAALLDYTAAQQPEGRTLRKRLEALKKRAPKSPMMSVRVISQRTSNPRATHIFRRGDFLQPQAEVQPEGLAVLHPLEPRNPDQPADRLDLANWLMAPDNPLTARVAVNQVWSQLFGRGIVRTLNDFGTRGEKPTHPLLLDWLASEYPNLGWSRKALIRLIVTSATYRQSSSHRPELTDVDPQNNLFYRQNRVRVEAEIVRDLFLAASGQLSKKIGGPSVFPPLPPDVAALSYANNFRWKTSTGEDRYRRGMYTFFKRTAPHPNLITFDCPDSNTATIERRTSNTPLMALTMLNNEVFAEAAQAFGKRLLEQDTADDRERMTRGFRLCVARPPQKAELAELLTLLQSAREYYQSNAEAAATLVGSYQPADVPPAEAAAWVATARILLNLDEFITRE